MEDGDLEKVLAVLEYCISGLRLSSYAKKQLKTDVVCLCIGLRPVVLVDYAEEMPEIGDQLVNLFWSLHQEAGVVLPLKLMVIGAMIYMIHVEGLAEFASSSLRFEHELFFVDLSRDPPQMLLHSEYNTVTSDFLSVQKAVSAIFPVNTGIDLNLPPNEPAPLAGPSEFTYVGLPLSTKRPPKNFIEIISMNSVMDDTEISMQTVTGWLLGFPVVYWFKTDDDCNAAEGPMHSYRIIVTKKRISTRKRDEDEIMCFTVPTSLSNKREKEPWAEAFLARMLAKFERCSKVWENMKLEVTD